MYKNLRLNYLIFLCNINIIMIENRCYAIILYIICTILYILITYDTYQTTKIITDYTKQPILSIYDKFAFVFLALSFFGSGYLVYEKRIFLAGFIPFIVNTIFVDFGLFEQMIITELIVKYITNKDGTINNRKLFMIDKYIDGEQFNTTENAKHSIMIIDKILTSSNLI